MKKFISILMAITTLFITLSLTVSATDMEPTVVYVDSYDEIPVNDMPSGVVYVFPAGQASAYSEIAGISDINTYSARDLNAPTSYWNIALKGEYTFAGSADDGELYTLYRFSGYVEYLVTVTNFKKLTRQTVNVYNAQGSKLTSFKVPANSTAVYKVETGTIGWYLGFEESCNVQGSVSRYSDEDVDGIVP